jgi:hypothetical protein
MSYKVTDSLLAAIKIFECKVWYNPDNKNLLNLIKDGRLNVEPACIKSLDKVGLNHLEIISVVLCIGHPLDKLPTADLDMLNLLEQKYKILFNAEEKLAWQDKRSHNKPCKHYMFSKLNNFYSSYVNGNWLASHALLQIQE